MKLQLLTLLLTLLLSVIIRPSYAIVGSAADMKKERRVSMHSYSKPKKISKWKLYKQLKKHRRKIQKVDGGSSWIAKLWLWLLAGFILLYPLGFLFPGAAGTLTAVALTGIGVLLGALLLFFVIGLLAKSEKKYKREYRNDGYYDSEGNYHYY